MTSSVAIAAAAAAAAGCATASTNAYAQIALESGLRTEFAAGALSASAAVPPPVARVVHVTGVGGGVFLLLYIYFKKNTETEF